MKAITNKYSIPGNNFIARSWNGTEKLWKVFWLYNVLAGVVIESAFEFVNYFGGSTKFILVPFLSVYFVWLSVSLWTCAFNAKHKTWGHVVRSLLLLSVIAAGIILILLFRGHDTYF